MEDTIVTSSELDNYGKLTEPMPQNAPRYNFRLLRQYCQKKKKYMSELTQKEIEQFRSN